MVVCVCLFTGFTLAVISHKISVNYPGFGKIVQDTQGARKDVYLPHERSLVVIELC